MLKPISFEIVFDESGESVSLKVKASGTDYAAYEEKFERSSYLDVIGMHYRAWTFIPWHAASRQGLTKLTFEEFEGLTPEIDTQAKVEENVPLEPTPPSGTLPS